MGTLLMRFVGPMQSWGTQSNFTMRDTGLEPSKSGVIGLICAAEGRKRDADLTDLSRLKMGVRVDREGVMKRDFHIVQDVLLGKGKGLKNSIITNRYYLNDAAFLVGLEGENNTLQSIQKSLKSPVWQLYFGRKSFIPSMPIWMKDGLMLENKLKDSLMTFPWIIDQDDHIEQEYVRIVLEDPDGEQFRNDVPISFATRKFVGRRVYTYMISTKQISEGVAI